MQLYFQPLYEAVCMCSVVFQKPLSTICTHPQWSPNGTIRQLYVYVGTGNDRMTVQTTSVANDSTKTNHHLNMQELVLHVELDPRSYMIIQSQSKHGVGTS